MYNICVVGMLEGKERDKETQKIFETIMTENFPQINARHQTTEAGSSENISRINTKKVTLGHIIFKL